MIINEQRLGGGRGNRWKRDDMIFPNDLIEKKESYPPVDDEKKKADEL